MTQLITPLVTLDAQGPSKAREAIVVGDLVTIQQTSDRPKVGARVVTTYPSGLYFVRVVGLAIPEPYYLGATMIVTPEQVVDWD